MIPLCSVGCSWFRPFVVVVVGLDSFEFVHDFVDLLYRFA